MAGSRRLGVDVYIERVQVEAEGFLAGLDVEFVPGLNVIIGARGTGKTSLIELIRFALGAGAFTEDAATKGYQQAVAVLEGGAVTVTVNHEGTTYTVTRSASGHLTSTGIGPFSCTVLAQNEVEAVGAQATGRLHLIDRFRDNRDETARSLHSLQAHVRSLTVELQSIMQEGTQLGEQISTLDGIPEQLAEALGEQQRLLESTQASEEDRRLLLQLQEASQSLASEEAIIEYGTKATSSLAHNIERLMEQTDAALPPWSIPKSEDGLLAARESLTRAQAALSEARAHAIQTHGATTAAAEASRKRKAAIEERSRGLRQSLESLQVGVGTATRRVAELVEQQGQLNALIARQRERRKAFHDLSVERDRVFQQLDDLRDRVFKERVSAAEALNKHLEPAVQVRVTRSQNIDEYRSAVIAALRGSGLHYNTLAARITTAVSPLELATWTERGRTSDLAEALGIATERAAAVIAALRSNGVADVVASSIEDGVSLSLLSGRDYKSSERLSIGQRCTVVLPVLLGHHGDPLLVDQPEDHLDNAFIASTLVTALLRRNAGDQFIFSSHNANLPVLGGADRVVVMDSDGDRGFVRATGSLEAGEVVDAVTRIMEGGAEAFATRARFYANQSTGSA